MILVTVFAGPASYCQDDHPTHPSQRTAISCLDRTKPGLSLATSGLELTVPKIVALGGCGT